MKEMYPVTEYGLQALKEKYKKLKYINGPEVIKALQTARAHGDLSENAEYDAAKQKQSELARDLRILEDKIGKANVINAVNVERIIFGAYVELKDKLNKIKTYQIVGMDEAQDDESGKKISAYSPLSRSLIGKKTGDIATVVIEDSSIKYNILNFYYDKKTS